MVIINSTRTVTWIRIFPSRADRCAIVAGDDLPTMHQQWTEHEIVPSLIGMIYLQCISKELEIVPSSAGMICPQCISSERNIKLYPRWRGWFTYNASAKNSKLYLRWWGRFMYPQCISNELESVPSLAGMVFPQCISVANSELCALVLRGWIFVPVPHGWLCQIGDDFLFTYWFDDVWRM